MLQGLDFCTCPSVEVGSIDNCNKCSYQIEWPIQEFIDVLHLEPDTVP